MAQRRMLDKKISISEKVASLPLKAQLLFTWMIPHADDLGLLPYSPRTIKAMVIPMWDDKVESIGILLEDIRKQDLIEVIYFRKTKYYHVKNFFDNQTLKKDRNPQSIMPLENVKNASESWEKAEVQLQQAILETYGNQTENTGNHLGTEVNRIEEKLIEVNRSEDKALENKRYISLDSLDETVFLEISTNYNVPIAFVRSKYDDLVNYCGSKGKAYKNYRLALMDWVKKDSITIRKEAHDKSKLVVISTE